MTPDTRLSEERLREIAGRRRESLDGFARYSTEDPAIDKLVVEDVPALLAEVAALQQREKALREIVECVAQDDFRFNGCRCTSDLPGECYLHSVLIPKALGAPGEEG